MHNKLIILVFLALCARINAFSDCNPGYYELTPNQLVTVNSPNYPPYGYYTPSSCQFSVTAAIYNKLQVSCYIYVGDRTTGCDVNDSFYILPDGTSYLYASNSQVQRYCGQGRYINTFTTPYNSVTMGYSSSKFSGYWTCNITSIPQSSCDCGTKTTSRIVGGQRTGVNQYPYMAAIMKYTGGAPLLKCGATILSTNILLTSAHCVVENNNVLTSNDIYVTMGQDDLKAAGYYAANYAIYRIVVHSQYNSNTDTYDAAMLILVRNIRFSRVVQPCCLPGANDPYNKYDGQSLIALGYGANGYGSEFTYYLKSAYVNGFPNSKCEVIYRNSGTTVTTQHLCTNGTDGSDACQGDSGGPVIFPTFRDVYAGMSTTGSGCGDGTPGVSTRIAPLMPWIEQTAPSKNYFCRYF